MKIEPNKYYSVNYIATKKIIPTFFSHFTLTAYLETEKGRELFKPIIKKTSSYTKYLVKGEILLEILKKMEEGSLKL